MSKHILYISAFRKNYIKELKALIRALGRRTQKPLWAEEIEKESEKILYLDRGGRGDLHALLKGVSSSVIEYVFFLEDREIYVISEILHEELNGEEPVLKCHESALEITLARIRKLSENRKNMGIFILEEDVFPRYKPYLKRKSKIKGLCEGVEKTEGKQSILADTENFDIYLSDAFNKNVLLCCLENKLHKAPDIIHIMGEKGEIYLPYKSLDITMFQEDAKFYKEAVYAISQWLSDEGLNGSKERLIKAMKSAKEDENFIENIIKEVSRKSGE